MQSRLFHYSISKAVVHAVFEATDESTGGSALVYEWTPPVAEREAAKLRLEALAGEVAGVEVFTADASLYLAAPTREAAGRALAMLQEHDLFCGEWMDQPQTLAASTPVPPPPGLNDWSPALAAPFASRMQPAGGGWEASDARPVVVDPPRVPFYGNASREGKKAGAGMGCALFFLGLVIFGIGTTTENFGVGILAVCVYAVFVAAVRKARK